VLAQGRPREVLTPANLARAFEIGADVVDGPEGAPLVVPHLPAAGSER
jgi:ABC-type cobalamin/Fe3+-siderophores transport system ATPase subunit